MSLKLSDYSKVGEARMDLLMMIAHQNNLIDNILNSHECGERLIGNEYCDSSNCSICVAKMYRSGH